MNEEVSGIILKQNDYREADVILTVITGEYGKISLVARGARKMTSRNRGSIFPYTLGLFQFDYRQDKTMFRMKTARTQKLFRHLHEDVKQSAAAAVICELTDALTVENRLTDIEFDLLLKALEYLEEGRDADLVAAVFIVEMMELFGISPDVDECVRCGSTKVHAVSAKDGGFLCAECAAKAGVPGKEPADLKRFRLLVKGGMKHIDIIEKAGGAKLQDLKILTAMTEQHAGIVLKSYRLYETLFGIE